MPGPECMPAGPPAASVTRSPISHRLSSPVSPGINSIASHIEPGPTISDGVHIPEFSNLANTVNLSPNLTRDFSDKQPQMQDLAKTESLWENPGLKEETSVKIKQAPHVALDRKIDLSIGNWAIIKPLEPQEITEPVPAENNIIEQKLADEIKTIDNLSSKFEPAIFAPQIQTLDLLQDMQDANDLKQRFAVFQSDIFTEVEPAVSLTKPEHIVNQKNHEGIKIEEIEENAFINHETIPFEELHPITNSLIQQELESPLVVTEIAQAVRVLEAKKALLTETPQQELVDQTTQTLVESLKEKGVSQEAINILKEQDLLQEQKDLHTDKQDKKDEQKPEEFELDPKAEAKRTEITGKAVQSLGKQQEITGKELAESIEQTINSEAKSEIAKDSDGSIPIWINNIAKNEKLGSPDEAKAVAVGEIRKTPPVRKRPEITTKKVTDEDVKRVGTVIFSNPGIN